MQEMLYNKCRHLGCHESFAYRTQRQRHEKLCEKEKPGVVSKPMKVTSENQQQQLQCSTCRRIYSCKQSFSEHKANCQRFTNNIKKEKKEGAEHICPVCGKRFPHRSKLLTHLKCHSKEQYTCYYCCKVYARKDHFKRHVYSHERDSSNSHQDTVENRASTSADLEAIRDLSEPELQNVSIILKDILTGQLNLTGPSDTLTAGRSSVQPDTLKSGVDSSTDLNPITWKHIPPE